MSQVPRMNLNSENKCILIVEDDRHIRNSLETFFKRQGMITLGAEDGLQGLEVLKRHRVDIVITDIMMPRMNGIKFIREVKKDFPDLQIVVITGYGDMNVAVEAMKLGAVDFVTKPFQFEYLEGIINDALAKGRSGAGSPSHGPEDINAHLKHKIEEISILYLIADALEHLNEGDEVFQALCDISRKTCGADRACYYLSDPGVEFRLLLHKCAPPEQMAYKPKTLIVPEKFRLELYESGHPVLIEDPGELQTALSSDGNLKPASSLILAPFFVRQELFGILCLETTQSERRFSEKDIIYTKLLLRKAGVAIENKALYETIYNNLIATLRSLVITIEAKDPYTRHHSARVTRLSVLIGREMGCAIEQIETLQFAGMLHDIGKIGVSDAVLQKKGSLTDVEFQAIKEHPKIGSKILEPIGMLPRENDVIRHHHERWDGRGYPAGLEGKDIPLLARIMTLADAYDAMTSDRVYRKGLSHDVALDEIARNCGRQFDGNIAKAFFSLCNRMKGGLFKFLQDDLGAYENT